MKKFFVEIDKRWNAQTPARQRLSIIGRGALMLRADYHAPIWHPVVELNGELKHLERFALDVVDVVVSKLKRFHANDQADIHAMVERGRVPHERFLERFKSAVDEFAYDARAEELPKYVANLHRVERDMLGVDETAIELPSWI